MRTKRKWWRKKTNQAIVIGILGTALGLNPVSAPFAPWVLKIAAGYGAYGVADRAGKDNEEG